MDLVSLLRSTFGFPGFRENQEVVCRSVAEGRDVLLVMPTGAGKSLCYQLPAVARGGAALVVSPLIALMDDQATKLTAKGLMVARIHSGLSRDTAREACRAYLDGSLQFLFIAPERLRVPGFPEMLARRRPSLIAIDEAHCISGWGHDFRPDYRTLGDYLPLLRPAPIIALTATATPIVQKDIIAQLSLADPALYIHGFRRDNLAIEVVELSKPQRAEFIAKFLETPATHPAIVYAPSRKAADELALQLNQHFPTASYHAGLDPATRERVQRHFQSGELDVVVATIAFGMGIDKANVRTILHAALPGSVEAYYQEIGRAGRDGLPSRAILLHSFADRRIHESFFERDYPPVEDLDRVARVLTPDFRLPDPLCDRLNMDPETFNKAVEKLCSQGAAQLDMDGQVRATGADTWRSGYKTQLAHRRAQLDRIVEFAETPQCRMSALVRHFGDRAGASRPCGHCDFCSPHSAAAQHYAEPTPAEDRDLRAILATLKTNRAIAAGRLFTDSAVGKDRKYFDRLLDGLARAGLLTFATEAWTNPLGREVTYQKVSLTHEGRELSLTAPLGVLLPETSDTGAKPRPTRPERRPERNGKESQAAFIPLQAELETRLRKWRKVEADQAGKPAFFVFSDAILHALVQAAPRTIPELMTIRGIGPNKADRYGAAICALCRGQDPTNLNANATL
jgi:ATP-dependent DNA helicase RecQ